MIVLSKYESPLENIIGRKQNYKVGLRVAFDDYCQIASADLFVNSFDLFSMMPEHSYDITVPR
jgi:hypothetical protein